MRNGGTNVLPSSVETWRNALGPLAGPEESVVGAPIFQDSARPRSEQRFHCRTGGCRNTPAGRRRSRISLLTVAGRQFPRYRDSRARRARPIEGVCYSGEVRPESTSGAHADLLRKFGAFRRLQPLPMPGADSIGRLVVLPAWTFATSRRRYREGARPLSRRRRSRRSRIPQNHLCWLEIGNCCPPSADHDAAMTAWRARYAPNRIGVAGDALNSLVE